MAHDSPHLSDLLSTVREFVMDIEPGLAGRDRYHALCAMYLLDIVMRELRGWEPMQDADNEMLGELIGGSTASGSALLSEVACSIRNGEFDDQMPMLFDAMLAHVKHKVAVTKPDHLAEPHD